MKDEKEFYNVQEIHNAQLKYRDEYSKCESNKEVVINTTKIVCDNKYRVIISKEIVRSSIKGMHEKLAQPGSTKLFETGKEYLSIKNIRNEIDIVIKGCDQCSKWKQSSLKYGTYMMVFQQKKILNLFV